MHFSVSQICFKKFIFCLHYMGKHFEKAVIQGWQVDTLLQTSRTIEGNGSIASSIKTCPLSCVPSTTGALYIHKVPDEFFFLIKIYLIFNDGGYFFQNIFSHLRLILFVSSIHVLWPFEKLESKECFLHIAMPPLLPTLQTGASYILKRLNSLSAIFCNLYFQPVANIFMFFKTK